MILSLLKKIIRKGAAVDKKGGFKTKQSDKTEGIWFDGF